MFLICHQDFVTGLEIQAVRNDIHTFGGVVRQGEFLFPTTKELREFLSNVIVQCATPIEEIVSHEGSSEFEMIGNRLQD